MVIFFVYMKVFAKHFELANNFFRYLHFEPKRHTRVSANKMNSANMEIPTAAELRKLRVVDLRKKLQSLELTQQGERRHGVRRAP